jgi:hypothetical protein
MKKTLVLLFAIPFLLVTSPAHAQTFKNCTEVRKVYPMGVAKSLVAAKKQKNYPVNNPLVSATIYKTIQKMDRDKDGTACEN